MKKLLKLFLGVGLCLLAIWGFGFSFYLWPWPEGGAWWCMPHLMTVTGFMFTVGFIGFSIAIDEFE